MREFVRDWSVDSLGDGLADTRIYEEYSSLTAWELIGFACGIEQTVNW